MSESLEVGRLDLVADLAAAEQRIEAQLENVESAYEAIGRELLHIRDLKLYRMSNRTFEEYYQQRWGGHRRRAYQLMDAAKVLGVLGTTVHKPASEGVVRELAPLLRDPDRPPEEQIPAVWQEVIERHGPEATAAQVREVVDEKVHNHRAQGTGENEWYTPAKYLDLARMVLGAVDLDPASSEMAQATVAAHKYFGVEDDGLSREWHGRVWLNPPYSQPHIENFTRKLVEEVNAGRVQEAILLTHNYTDTAWFHHAAAHCSAICFTRGRIRFVSPTGEEASPTQGQAFFYFGPRPGRFEEHFTGIGFVLGAYRQAAKAAA